ncbi:hypothetical protein [Streptococcus pyogenes]|nr:hypothetical protein [Streptococcus pyogenes]
MVTYQIFRKLTTVAFEAPVDTTTPGRQPAKLFVTSQMVQKDTVDVTDC